MTSTRIFSDFAENPKAVVLDVETTGTNTDTARIVSLAIVKLNFSTAGQTETETLEDFHVSLINPQVPIPKDASRIHGIYDSDVAGHKTFADIAQTARDFIGNTAVIAHNVSYDKTILNNEFKRAGVKLISRNRGYCTMKRISELRAKYGYDDRWPKLEDAADIFGIEGRLSGKHGALEDATLTLQIAFMLFKCDTGAFSKETLRQTFNPNYTFGDFKRESSGKRALMQPPIDIAKWFWIAIVIVLLVIVFLN